MHPMLSTFLALWSSAAAFAAWPSPITAVLALANLGFFFAVHSLAGHAPRAPEAAR